MEEPVVIPSEGERMVYLVASRTRAGKRYRVDLLGMAGASQCACKDWDFVVIKNITAGNEWGLHWKRKDRTTCYHSYEARKHFCNALLKRMAQNDDSAQRVARPAKTETENQDEDTPF